MQPTSTNNSLMLPSSVAGNLPAMVRNELSQMSAINQEAFLEDYKRKAKGAGMSYLFWLLFGLHYGYLGMWGKQVLFWCTLGGLGFWWFIDAFRIPGIVASYNKDVATDVMRNLKAIGSR